MYKFRVTFMNQETHKKKVCVVEARGICPAIEAACAKGLAIGWDIYSAKLITK